MVEKTVIVEKIVVQEKIVVEEKTVYVDRSPAFSKSSTSRPEPKFKAGQAVRQWWAPWMAGATKMRESIGKKRTACVVQRLRAGSPSMGRDSLRGHHRHILGVPGHLMERTD